MEVFREFLEEWLRQTGTSQAELHRLSGVPQNVISRWLSQDPTQPGVRNLKKLAPVLGVPYEELLKLVGYLPGEARIDQIDPELAATTAALHARWPSWDEGFRRAVQTLIGGGGQLFDAYLPSLART